MKRRILALLFLFCFIGYNLGVYAEQLKYPDYAYEFLGPDKHEKYNRKMFNFDLGLNKYVIRPIHILWASILPQYVMDRLFGISNNIEYPIRLVSSLVQRDFHNAGNETKRFLINTTIGLAGMFDPAKRMLKIERSRDNMDKAFSRCNIKPGTYFVAPVIAFTSIRDIFGRIFDIALNPSTYVATPLAAIIKASMTINRTSYIQTIIYLVESNYADPYEVTKKAFGINEYIKKNNFDRVQVMSELRAKPSDSDNGDNLNKEDTSTQTLLNVSAKIVDTTTSNSIQKMNITFETMPELKNVSIKPDIFLEDYAPQSPVVDSLRTSLFILPKVYDSMWNEFSLWNNSFASKFKTDSINIVEGKANYVFKYRLQKDKNAPLAIIYPSTGDGVNASHPLMFAKMFYDLGFSVLIQGNPFQWEFVKSMPDDYRPGLPIRDAQMMRLTINKIINKLQQKHNCSFENKIILGTSLAAIDVLFMAEQESIENTLGNTYYIAICPPIDLMYSMKVVDSYMEKWQNFHDDLKGKVAYTSAKIVKLYQAKQDIDFIVNHMPFDEDEAKLITSFMMHQKLSDVIFTLEKAPTNKVSGIYNMIYQMDYEDYMTKYILTDDASINKELSNGFGLISISEYLHTASNYRIYHTLNDYLINKAQLKLLKYLAGANLTIMDNGSHMGFIYRTEFIEDLKKTIEEIHSKL